MRSRVAADAEAAETDPREPTLLFARLLLEHGLLPPAQRRWAAGRRARALRERLAIPGEAHLLRTPAGWSELVGASLRLLGEPGRRTRPAKETRPVPRRRAAAPAEADEEVACSDSNPDPPLSVFWLGDKGMLDGERLPSSWRLALRQRRPVLLVADAGVTVPPPCAALLDGELALPETTVAMLRELGRRLARGPGADPPPPEAEGRGPSGAGRRVQSAPPDLDPTDLAPDLLGLAWQEGLDAGAFLQRLARLQARRRAIAPAATGPRLADLHGLGEAGAWARRLVHDLRGYRRGELGWDDVDRGAVLVGPPGTGKTTLAGALARTAGVPLLATSLQQWQGARDGHLGTLLAAMQASFSEARRLAPSILLIDEIDGFTARSELDARHRDYSTQVVNGLLELLDGVQSRPGVVVIGTCNDARHLDPALLRPGRLERLLAVPRPDAAGLRGIWRHHLGAELPGARLAPLARAAEARGATGAEVALWCRDARRRARQARRPLQLRDLRAEVGPPPSGRSPEAWWRAALHEAGHAVAAVLLLPGVLRGVTLRRAAPVADGVMLGCAVLDAARQAQLIGPLTPSTLRRQLTLWLAGRAAEIDHLGEASVGAGGPDDSDLARATDLASRALASGGLGEGPEALLWHAAGSAAQACRLLREHPALRRQVAATLAAAEAAALDLVRAQHKAVAEVAQRLLQHGEVRASQVTSVVQRMATSP